ncbi:nitroreductase family protein [Bacillus atrophaeus]|uniref:nitroreductase family protein n=1 Tax=Bacillus atrophaeus TaxID=1452 RepID=UPI001238C67F|nr:nitroreductase family protein [Bacillus atrophaeus]KAA6443868.1 dehydrogenase [Bacillus atrophaeus]
MAVASFEPFQLIDQLIEETKDFHFDSGTLQQLQEIEHHKNDSRSVLLPDQRIEGEELFQVFKERTATRFYDRAPVDFSDVGTILSAAKEEDARHWQRQISKGIDITLSVIAWRIENLQCPYFYDYCPETHSLVPAGEIPEQAEAENWFLQKEFMFAPAIIIVHGTMNKAVQHYGGHGYRHLMVRGGAAAHNAWLSALTLGLTGTVFAGALPRPLRVCTHIDGRHRTQLCAFSFGKPITFTDS